jgi:uncharacterized protein
MTGGGLGGSLKGPGKEAESLAQVWVPSRFNLSVGLPRQRKAVLNTFTGTLLVLAGETWRRHLASGRQFRCDQAGATEGVALLQSQGLLVPQNVNELDVVRLHYLSEHFSDSRLGVTVVPTLACNLSCSYCFQGTAQTPGVVRTWTKAREDQVVQYIASAASGKKAMDLCWFGGEPLLAIKTISRVSSLLIPACKQAGMSYSATLVTNGTLLSRDVVGTLEKCGLRYIQVTVDIPAAEKRDRRGCNTVEAVLDNLAFAARRIPTHLRINLGRDEPAEFDRLYDALVRRNLHHSLKRVHFAHVFVPECGPRGCGFAAMPYPIYAQVSTRERRRAKASCLPVDDACWPEAIGCRATTRHSMVIGPDGLLYKCPHDVGLVGRNYGSVETGTPTNLANLVPWLMYDWLQYERCAECPILPGCGGGCPHLHRFQPEQFDAMRYCESLLQQLRDRIQDRALAADGVQSGAVRVIAEEAQPRGLRA